MKALIDCDIIVYRCGFAGQKTRYTYLTEEGFIELPVGTTMLDIKSDKALTGGTLEQWQQVDALPLVLHSTKRMFEGILEALDTEDYIGYLSTARNFRHDIATIKPYKGNRKKDKPIYYEEIRNYLLENYEVVEVDGVEADDAMGCEAVRTPGSVICTLDKDLDMVPGAHYNFVTGEHYTTKDPGKLKLSKNKRTLKGGGLVWFYAQMLLGDNADNIPGIKGLGPVKVYNKLKSCTSEEDMLYLISEAYKYSYKQTWKEALLEIADLLWIQREPNETKSKQLITMLNGMI